MRYAVLASMLVMTLSGAEVGPASTAVVINADSPASGAVARMWMRLRGIPEAQAIELRGMPAGHHMPLADFRSQILEVVEAALIERGLADQISLIAYAPDLPTAIDFTVAEGAQNWQSSPGSITGLTLLAPLLDQPSTVFTALRANLYAERVRQPGHQLNAVAAADPREREAYTALHAKDFIAARDLFTAMAKDHPAPSVYYNLACVQALSGALEAAEQALDQAIAAGWMDLNHTEQDDDLTALRTRPAWAGLLARITAGEARLEPDSSPPFRPLVLEGKRIPGRLAMVLTNLGPRGLTSAEAEAQLTATVAADGTAPAGTIWFMASEDRDRTGPRRWAFTAAAAAVRGKGVSAEVRAGTLPPRDEPVAGAVIGCADFNWAASGARMLPGAWCDHLTSSGGALQAGADQTPLSAFLRAGAAGAGGAVSEPFNLAQKFPSAFVHLHRLRGLSLVEAVHRTLPCPYQYLVVGDPLSRPWPARVQP